MIKNPVSLKIFGVINLVMALLLIGLALPLGLLVFEQKYYYATLMLSLYLSSALWLLAGSVNWFFSFGKSYVMILFSFATLLLIALADIFYGFFSGEASPGEGIIFVCLAILPFLYAIFLFISLFSKNIHEWTVQNSIQKKPGIPLLVLFVLSTMIGYGIIFVFNKIYSKEERLAIMEQTSVPPEICFALSDSMYEDGWAFNAGPETSVTLNLKGGGVEVTSLKIYYGKKARGSLKNLRIAFSDGSTQDINLMIMQNPHVITLKPTVTSFVRIHALSAIPALEVNVSEIEVYGARMPFHKKNVNFYAYEKPTNETYSYYANRGNENSTPYNPYAEDESKRTFPKEKMNAFFQSCLRQTAKWYFTDYTNETGEEQSSEPVYLVPGKITSSYYGNTALLSLLIEAACKDYLQLSDTVTIPLQDMIENISGHKLYVSETEHLNSINPEFIDWLNLNMIPSPTEGYNDYSASMLYDAAFQSYVRELSDGYNFFMRNGYDSYMTEVAGVKKAMEENPDFDMRSYLTERFGEKEFEVSSENTMIVLNKKTALGFWLRRGADGTSEKVYNLLVKLLYLYDPSYYNCCIPRG